MEIDVERFTQTEALIESNAEQCSSSSSSSSFRPIWQAEPPNDVRAGSKEYYKKLYEAQLEISPKQLPVCPEDLGIVNVQHVFFVLLIGKIIDRKSLEITN